MNTKRFYELIDRLEQTKKWSYQDGRGIPGFSLTDWRSMAPELDDKVGDSIPVPKFTDLHPCQTVACIAGHVIALFKPEQYSSLPIHYFMPEAADLLDISFDVATNLFNPGRGTVSHLDWCYEDVTVDDAIQAVRNVMDGATRVEAIWGHMEADIDPHGESLED